MIDLPIVFVDTDGFWQPLVRLIDHVVAAGFAASAAERLYRVVQQPEDVIPACFDQDLTPKT
jgi:predicted Rossmann-fold nucleotide-binding protein